MQLINGMNRCKEAKIRYKVFRAFLDAMHYGLRHLDNVPLKCIPRVLQHVQVHMFISETIFGTCEPRLCITRDTSCSCLSGLFRIIRGWEMPALFSYGGSDCRKTSKKGRRKRKRPQRNAKIS